MKMNVCNNYRDPNIKKHCHLHKFDWDDRVKVLSYLKGQSHEIFRVFLQQSSIDQNQENGFLNFQLLL
jgi:hypothetical protein